MSGLSKRARTAQGRAAKRWFVYLILCRGGAIYTGIALSVAVRYAQHCVGTGARYTRANPPRRLLGKFSCANQSEAARLEAQGYRIGGATNAERHDYARSMVMFVPGWIKEARRLAHDTGIRMVAPVDGLHAAQLKGSGVVLLLGK